MIYRYEIRNNGTEDILYLYLNLNSEFSKEIGNLNDDNNLSNISKNFIANNDIKFKGKKVFLIIDGIVVKALDISKVAINYQSNPSFSNEHFLINIKLDDNSFLELSLRRYLLGILANVYNSNYELETLKCIAILYRTYAYKMMKENNFISNSSFFKYDDITSYKLKWLNDYKEISEKIEKAVDETDCIFVNYNNEYILPFIHFSNNGFTLENKLYPYLSSVLSLWDLCNPHDKEVNDYSYNSISKLLGTKISKNTSIEIIEVDDYSQIIKLKINDKLFTGEEIRQLLDLKSLNFNIILYKKFFRIVSFGFGNSLGLSLYGANELALDGLLYPEIITYYFPKVKLNKYIKELPN